jgi:ribosomal-protein-alanine N-acetyltransferase
MSEKKFSPFPLLQTERLKLRRLDLIDWKAIIGLRDNEEVGKYIERQKLVGKDAVKEFIEKINNDIDADRSIYWVICLSNNPELIGTTCLWNFSEDRSVAELGYELLPTHQGWGLMTEAIHAVREFAANHCALSKLEAYTNRENQNSLKLLRKFGFQLIPEKVDVDNLNNAVYELILGNHR